jgi:uncharacterized membrane protein HdeD (DUF308 family)
MAMTLARRWWTFVLRGIAAICFAIFVFTRPAEGLLALVLFYGAYALAEGLFTFFAGLRSVQGGKPWGVLTFSGVVSMLAGALALLWPGLTAGVLLLIIAAWAVVTGIAAIVAAIRLRKQVRGEWLLVLSGLLTIGFGVLVFLNPGAGALGIVLAVGAYALVFGVMMIALGVRLRSWAKTPERQMPTGATPTRF